VPVKVQRVDDIGRMKVRRVRLDGVRLNALAAGDMRIDGDDARLSSTRRTFTVYADGHRVGSGALRAG
jgi:glycerol transport system ATP-binding protein